MSRLRTLVGKELLDLRRNRAALVPVVLVMMLSIAVGFGVAVAAPALSGHPLSEDSGLVRISEKAAPPDAALSADARAQLFLFQQFLLLFVITPITGAMSLAAHAIVGEKQARTLEPLLATPITTIELLVAKIFGALLPTFGISLAGFALYFAGIAAFGQPGVVSAMATARTALLVLGVGPAAALVSLQAAVVISSRVNDARTAQQFAILIIVPLTGVFVAQFNGTFWLTATTLSLTALALFGVWVLLVLFSAALFERESILTRWR